MDFWLRSATLQIWGNRYSMDDLAFDFEVPFEDSDELTTATVNAYNLSANTRNSIKKGDPVIITIEGNILTDPVPQIRSRQLSCTDSAIFGYGSIHSANYGYDGPIKYYSAADAPQESSAASSEDWESADLWWNPEEEQEVSRREKREKGDS